jgi:acyl-CoA thioester hydrolase
MPANGSGPPEAHPPSALFDEHRDVVRPEWIDENGHFNMGYYVVAFDRATDAWLHHIGLTASKRERSGVTTFTLESHVNYLGEVLEAAPLRFTTRLLGFDQKRIHYFHEMYHATEGFLAATNELMSLHVNLETRRGGVMAEDLLARLADILSRHQTLPVPPQVGRRIGLDANP